MQCVTCGFENMPGSDACGRCGTSMRLATAILDVQPPRAGRFRKKIRRILPVRKVYYGVRDRAENVPVPRLPRVSDLDLPRWNVRQELPPWSIAWRMVAPGWSHF